jgi:hypothetical protein
VASAAERAPGAAMSSSSNWNFSPESAGPGRLTTHRVRICGVGCADSEWPKQGPPGVDPVTADPDSRKLARRHEPEDEGSGYLQDRSDLGNGQDQSVAGPERRPRKDLSVGRAADLVGAHVNTMSPLRT